MDFDEFKKQADEIMQERREILERQGEEIRSIGKTPLSSPYLSKIEAAAKKVQPGNPKVEGVLADLEQIASNTKIDDTARQEKYGEWIQDKTNAVMEGIAEFDDHVVATRADLGRQASPFGSEAAQIAYNRAVSEMRTAGPGHKQAVLDAAYAACQGDDVGDLAFYHKRLEQVFEKAPQGPYANHGPYAQADVEKCRAALDKAVDRLRTDKQRSARKSLDAFNARVSEVEESVEFARFALKQGAGVGELYPLRPRTWEEQRAIDKRTAALQAKLESEMNSLLGRK